MGGDCGKHMAWILIIIGVLMILPLLNVTLGVWADWVIALGVLLLGIKLLKADCGDGKGKKRK